MFASHITLPRPVLRLLPVGLSLLLVSAIAQAQAPIVQPGAPGQPSRLITAEQASELLGLQYTEADVKFMQSMIAHHAQAVRMAALVPERTNREAIRVIALRIALSQEDEMTMMRDWLSDRGEPTETPMAHMDHEGHLMPGMLSEDEFTALEAASGPAFDNLFLELMIKHHQGALTMVDDLLAQPGSAQDSVLYAFTTDVTADQTSEIERMDAMLVGFNPDPRVNLKAGFLDAGEAALNMQLVASMPKPDGFFDPQNPAGLPVRRARELAQQALNPEAPTPPADAAQAVNPAVRGEAELDTDEEEDEQDTEPRPGLLNFANTDMVFAGDVLIVGNYHGFNAYDVSNPNAPQLLSSVVCPGGQGDVSVVGNLLIMSVEQTRGRMDCGLQGVAEPVSQQRFRGIRIFDVSDFRLPVQVGAVQTCRGSHTHTVVADGSVDGNIYVYGSGTAQVRPGEELDGCVDESPFENPESALFRIDVIRIPVARPQDAAVVNRPFIFSDPQTGVLAGLWEGGDHGHGTQNTRQTNQCHDITAYPEIGLAAGACSGNGILLDISDPQNPRRIDEVIDTGFSYWHSATFNNDGTKVLFTDEWGGGSRPRCRSFDPIDWGADAFYDIVDGKLQYRSHFKMPAPQTETENCVAHNGSLVPVPGRDIFVQSWYQGGISVIDFTDSANPVEIAYFDRGPVDEEELITAGYWSSYWYGGHIFGTEIARGLDIFTLTPSDFLSANEIAAASIKIPGQVVNAQQQTRHVWPHEPVVARAYVDQLQRSGVIAQSRVAELERLLTQADDLLAGGNPRNAGIAGQLTTLAQALAQEGNGASGLSRSRFAALADTLNGIASRLQ
ncbi:MAG: hypothetical protein RLZZ385_1275 [Pseudomonadota bacterium]